jgi:hypothetical protein
MFYTINDDNMNMLAKFYPATNRFATIVVDYNVFNHEWLTASMANTHKFVDAFKYLFTVLVVDLFWNIIAGLNWSWSFLNQNTGYVELAFMISSIMATCMFLKMIHEDSEKQDEHISKIRAILDDKDKIICELKFRLEKYEADDDDEEDEDEDDEDYVDDEDDDDDDDAKDWMSVSSSCHSDPNDSDYDPDEDDF